ncbi:MAG: type II toxin-antitoxin system Phd/YefM family antitoxin [Acidimicrobiia bacterium]
MSNTMTVSEARASLPEIVERVSAGEEVTLTRHGVPVAVVVRPDLLRVRRVNHALSKATEVEDILELGRRSNLNAQGAMTAERANELVADVRSARSRR